MFAVPTRSRDECGHLQLIFGPMFCGKSSELIRRINRYQLSNYPCLLIRYANDTRYSQDKVSTHSGKTFPAVLALSLSEIFHLTNDYKVIGIDEGQFFPDILDFCGKLLHQGKIIIVAGLDATYQRVGFGQILHLVPLARTVDKLSAICMSCGDKAVFTKRIVKDSGLELIGGADKYMATCRECYKLSSPRKRTPFKELTQPQQDHAHQKEQIKKDLFNDD